MSIICNHETMSPSTNVGEGEGGEGGEGGVDEAGEDGDRGCRREERW